MHDLAHPNSLLFAVEPANIWLDPSQNVPSTPYAGTFVVRALDRLAEITSAESIVTSGPMGPCADRGLCKWAPRLLASWDEMSVSDQTRLAPWKAALERVDMAAIFAKSLS